ncbi:MAG: hypothetical protein KY432_06795, partial [Acidobacteria bacterium]|nr:hypothetical protein [Acidobacteriota bacterium]
RAGPGSLTEHQRERRRGEEQSREEVADDRGGGEGEREGDRRVREGVSREQRQRCHEVWPRRSEQDADRGTEVVADDGCAAAGDTTSKATTNRATRAECVFMR